MPITLPTTYSEEMLLYEKFFRTSIFRRVNDLHHVWNRSDITELPRGSILHLIDDNFLMNKPIVLVPDTNGWAMKLQPDRKYVMHVTEPPYPNVMNIEEYFTLPSTGVTVTIMNFKKRNQLLMRPINGVPQFPKENRSEVQSIVSYNSLYRARIFGQLRGYRRFNYIFTNIFNLIGAFEDGRRHFIPIPVGDRVIDRGKLMLTFEKHNKGTLKLSEDPWYLFIVHLMGFLKVAKTPSLFEKIPQKYWEYINFMLYTRNKIVILNLKVLKDLNIKDSILWRTLNLINLLAEEGHQAAIQDFADSPVVYDTKEDPGELLVEADTPFEEKEIPHVTIPPTPVPDPEPVQETPQEEPTEDQDEVKEEEPPVVKQQVAPVKSIFTIRKDRTIDAKVTQKQLDEEKAKIEKYLDFEPERLQIDPKWLEVEMGEGTSNTPKFKGNISKEKQIQSNKNLIQEIDISAKAKIEEDPRLTEKQIKQTEQVAQQYKTIKIGEKTIQQIIEEVPDDIVSTNELEFLKDDSEVMDKSMLKSSVATFEHDYMKKMFTRDLMMDLTSFNKHGMFLKNVEVTDVSDSLNQLNEYKCSYEDTQKKVHTIKFKMPKVDDRGYCYINGTLAVVKKQRIPLPICKLSPTRVSLTSDYNKYLVTRNTTVAHSFVNYIESLLEKGKDQVRISTGSYTWNNIVLPYEYTSLAKKYLVIELQAAETITFYFNYPERHSWLSETLRLLPDDLETIKTIESDTKTVAIAGVGERKIAFMDVNNEIVVYSLDDATTSDRTTMIDIICSTLGITPTPLSEWTEVDMTSTPLPVVFCLCYRYGLSAMLNYTNTQYRVVESGSRSHRMWSDIVIRFADKTLIIPRAPLVNSLLFAGLNFFKLNKINMEEMDSKDIYFDLLQAKKKSVHYLKAVDNFFDFFIDPICREVLEQMGEPTDPRDLLIRATQLLSTEDHNHQASSMNFRFRSYERMVSAVYKTLSKSFAAYRSKSVGATHKWSIADFEIQQMIMQDQLKENVDLINPINDIKYQEEFSHGGIAGGRKSLDTFTVNDRRYTEDSVGIISEATVDSAKTGFAASMSMDPTIKNMRGMTVSELPEDLAPTQMLSISSLIMPGVTQDDSKRQNLELTEPYTGNSVRA